MKRPLLLALIALLSAACQEKDSVPKVKDVNNIVVDGEPMTKRAFLDKYCMDKALNETCIMVSRSYSADATRTPGGVPRF